MAGNKITIGNVEITSLSDGILEFDLCNFFPRHSVRKLGSLRRPPYRRPQRAFQPGLLPSAVRRPEHRCGHRPGAKASRCAGNPLGRIAQ